MLIENKPIEKIARYTKLIIEEIKTLQAEIKKIKYLNENHFTRVFSKNPS
ncbi:MAG: Transposase [Rickettsia helvetica]|uniref:Transposase n=1 Tax=Rickettsia helvetica TaxID=35789 RepID=A0ABP0T3A6_RICHE